MKRRYLGVLLLAGVAASADAPVPWPRGIAPGAGDIDAQLASATEIADREQTEEFLAAAEHGEESEHLRILQEDVDAGVYDKKRLFTLGDEFFSHAFTLDDGYGDGTFHGFRRVHAGVRGGLDTFSCAGCHSVGGPDGAGSPTQNALLEGDGERVSSALPRNPPALLGVGMVQALAAEMSGELRRQLDDARIRAGDTGGPVTVALQSKGIDFGTAVAGPGGEVDTSGVRGVDADLVVKPFGWKGTVARLRRFVEDAARVHFGIQSHVLALGDRDHPDPNHLGSGPWYDPDGDGHQRELEEGMLSTAAAYLAMLEVPVVIPPADDGLRDRWARGSALFDSTGCAACHVRSLVLLDTTWDETSDTTGGDLRIDLFADGDAPRGTNAVELFSDLKRHDMGPVLADPHAGEHGVALAEFLTRPLWGLAESAPYLHDGRAPTIPEAILAHGGEAQVARDAFAALAPEDQANLHIFLLSLTREPRVRVAR